MDDPRSLGRAIVARIRGLTGIHVVAARHLKDLRVDLRREYLFSIRVVERPRNLTFIPLLVTRNRTPALTKIVQIPSRLVYNKKIDKLINELKLNK